MGLLSTHIFKKICVFSTPRFYSRRFVKILHFPSFLQGFWGKKQTLSVIAARCQIPPFVAARHLPPAGGSLSSQGELNSLSQNLSVLPAPSGREPLAWRKSLRLKYKAACPGVPLPSCRFASSHLPQGDGFSGGGKVSGIAQRRPLGGAGCERSEQTAGVLGLSSECETGGVYPSPPTPKQPDCPGGAVWLRGLILPASCWRDPLLRRADRRRPAGASCRRGWGNRWAG